MKTLFVFLCCVFAFASFLVLGAMDYASELAEQRVYCEMVAEGSWPDYRDMYEAACVQ